MSNELEAEIIAKLRHIADLAKRADGVVGMVDHPHVRALRTASSVAQEMLNKISSLQKEPDDDI